MSKSRNRYTKKIFIMTLCISAAFLAAGVLFSLVRGVGIKGMLEGFAAINTTPTMFSKDYFLIGGIGGAFFNTGCIGLLVCLFMKLTGAETNSLYVAAFWLNVGFATCGITVLTFWQFILGGFIYARFKKVKLGSIAVKVLFSTALAPFLGEMMLRYPGADPTGLHPVGILMSALMVVPVIFLLIPLLDHAPNFHKGFNLYNAGPATGFIAALIYGLLYKAPGVILEAGGDAGEGERMLSVIFFFLLFMACVFWACCADSRCVKRFMRIFEEGCRGDHCERHGFEANLFNMGVYGLFILAYYLVVMGISSGPEGISLVPARFTGMTVGAIMCMTAFSFRGAGPRNVFPIIIGYVLASLIPLLSHLAGFSEVQSWHLASQGMLVGVCFASGLAPVTDKFGAVAGIGAGFIHAMMVGLVPLIHGGFCLYNGGFTAAITAFILVPFLENCIKPSGMVE